MDKCVELLDELDFANYIGKECITNDGKKGTIVGYDTDNLNFIIGMTTETRECWHMDCFGFIFDKSMLEDYDRLLVHSPMFVCYAYCHRVYIH